jgi:hypothetical protein
MSYWTHLICEQCWAILHPGKPAVKLHGVEDPCCFCGALTSSGIYVREASAGLHCKGTGPVHQGDEQ